MAQVVFDPVAFKEAYPAFAAVSDAALQQYFDIACMYLSNSDCSVVQDVAKRKTLLWMLTAHVAQLSGALNPMNQAGVSGAAAGAAAVGRVASGTEGSVTASFDYPMSPGSEWYAQTQWGAMFWAATAYLRSFRYRPRPTRY